MSLTAPLESLPLFALARPADPPTSKAAAERATTGLSRTREAVLRLYLEWESRFPRAMTDRDMVAFASQADLHGNPRATASPSGLRSRRAELTKAGYLEPVGTVELDGGRHTLHRLTASGRRILGVQ